MSISESLPAGAQYMLSCQAVDRQAIHYFFNGLSKGRSERIRSHLADCPRCRSKLEIFARVWFLDGERRKALLDDITVRDRE
jgi:hypothetical protein